MVLHRLLGDEELLRDLLIPLALRRELQDFPLAVRELPARPPALLRLAAPRWALEPRALEAAPPGERRAAAFDPTALAFLVGRLVALARLRGDAAIAGETSLESTAPVTASVCIGTRSASIHNPSRS